MGGYCVQQTWSRMRIRELMAEGETEQHSWCWHYYLGELQLCPFGMPLSQTNVIYSRLSPRLSQKMNGNNDFYKNILRQKCFDYNNVPWHPTATGGWST